MKICLSCGKPMQPRTKTETCAECRSTHAGVLAERRRRAVSDRARDRVRARWLAAQKARSV